MFIMLEARVCKEVAVRGRQHFVWRNKEMWLLIHRHRVCEKALGCFKPSLQRR